MKELNTFEIESVSGGSLTDSDVKEIIMESAVIVGMTAGTLTGAITFGNGIPGLTVIAGSVGGVSGIAGGLVFGIPCMFAYDIYSKLS